MLLSWEKYCPKLYYLHNLEQYPFIWSYKPIYRGFLIAAWAAARRAMGTRKGEQET